MHPYQTASSAHTDLPARACHGDRSLGGDRGLIRTPPGSVRFPRCYVGQEERDGGDQYRRQAFSNCLVWVSLASSRGRRLVGGRIGYPCLCRRCSFLRWISCHQSALSHRVALVQMGHSLIVSVLVGGPNPRCLFSLRRKSLIKALDQGYQLPVPPVSSGPRGSNPWLSQPCQPGSSALTGVTAAASPPRCGCSGGTSAAPPRPGWPCRSTTSGTAAASRSLPLPGWSPSRRRPAGRSR